MTLGFLESTNHPEFLGGTKLREDSGMKTQKRCAWEPQNPENHVAFM